MVSRHVALLERECGAWRFRRTSRRVVLTEFGEQIYPCILALIAEAEQIADDIRVSGGMLMGELRVGLLPTTISVLVSMLFLQIRDRFPKIKPRLSDGASHHVGFPLTTLEGKERPKHCEAVSITS